MGAGDCQCKKPSVSFTLYNFDFQTIVEQEIALPKTHALTDQLSLSGLPNHEATLSHGSCLRLRSTLKCNAEITEKCSMIEAFA